VGHFFRNLLRETPVPSCELDHIVIGAATLEQGEAFVRDRLGVEIGPGGRHALMGTHNRLMRLGQNAYLEVIAIDPAAPRPGRPRWYSLDDAEMQARLGEEPSLICWVLRVSDIVAAVQSAAVPLGEVTSVSRGDLSWRLTVPADGHLPGGGTVPHLIEWDCGARPWERMAAAGCDLETLILRHPKPEWLDQALHAFCPAGFGFASCERGEEPKLSARIITPSGVKII
jgi:hypothetical protein